MSTASTSSPIWPTSLELSLRPPDESLAVHADSNGRDADHDDTIAFSSVKVKSRQLAAAGQQTLHVYPMAQIKHLGTLSNVGLVVLSGPVSRVSQVMALDDLVTSSGWPVLGVVGSRVCGAAGRGGWAGEAATDRGSIRQGRDRS